MGGKASQPKQDYADHVDRLEQSAIKLINEFRTGQSKRLTRASLQVFQDDAIDALRKWQEPMRMNANQQYPPNNAQVADMPLDQRPAQNSPFLFDDSDESDDFDDSDTMPQATADQNPAQYSPFMFSDSDYSDDSADSVDSSEAGEQFAMDPHRRPGHPHVHPSVLPGGYGGNPQHHHHNHQAAMRNKSNNAHRATPYPPTNHHHHHHQSAPMPPSHHHPASPMPPNHHHHPAAMR